MMHKSLSTRRSLTNESVNESIQSVLHSVHQYVMLAIVAVYQDGSKSVSSSITQSTAKNALSNNRMLVLTHHRICSMTMKIPSRMDKSVHFLDLCGLSATLRQPPSPVDSPRLAKKSSSSADSVEAACHVTLHIKDDKHGLRFKSNDVDGTARFLHALLKRIDQLYPDIDRQAIIGSVSIDVGQSEPLSPHVQRLQKQINDKFKSAKPCGNLSAQYESACDWLGLRRRDEVTWDIDTIYYSRHASSDFTFRLMTDFGHLDVPDLCAIVASLEYNSCFTRLDVGCDAGPGSSSLAEKLNSPDLVDRIMGVVAHSPSLCGLSGRNAGWKSHADILSKLTSALATRLAKFASSTSGAPRLKFGLDLAENCIFDDVRCNVKLASVLSNYDITDFHVGHSQIAPKQLSPLLRAVGPALIDLSLTSIPVKQDPTLEKSLFSLLTSSPSLHSLDLSRTEMNSISLELLFEIFNKGSLGTSLVSLTLANAMNCAKRPVKATSSKRSVTASKGVDSTDTSSAVKSFFMTFHRLRHVNLSGCRLMAENLKHILLGLACNETVNTLIDFSLVVANNATLNSVLTGADAENECFSHIVETCLAVQKESADRPGVRLSHLDMSACRLDAEAVAAVVRGAVNCSPLTSLSLAKNSHQSGQDLDHLADLLSNNANQGDLYAVPYNQTTHLACLNLADIRNKGDLSQVLNMLASNRSVTEIDISGNNIGDSGARLLAKALQVNTRLQTLHFDKNQITLAGYRDVMHGLQYNNSLKHISYPVCDLSAAMSTKGVPDRLAAVWTKIESRLRLNRTKSHWPVVKRQGYLSQFTLRQIDSAIDGLQSLHLDPFHGECAELKRSDAIDRLLDVRGVAKSDSNAASSQKWLDSISPAVDSLASEIGAKVCSTIGPVDELKSVIMRDVRGQLAVDIKQKALEILHASLIVRDSTLAQLSVSDALAEADAIIQTEASRSCHISNGGRRHASISAQSDGSSTSSAVAGVDLSLSTKQRPDIMMSSSSAESLLSVSPGSVTVDADSGVLSATPDSVKSRSVLQMQLNQILTASQKPRLADASEAEGKRLEHVGQARPRRPKRHAPSRGSVSTIAVDLAASTDDKVGDAKHEVFLARFSSSSPVPPLLSVIDENTAQTSVQNSFSFIWTRKATSAKPSELHSDCMSKSGSVPKASLFSCLSANASADSDTNDGAKAAKISSPFNVRKCTNSEYVAVHGATTADDAGLFCKSMTSSSFNADPMIPHEELLAEFRERRGQRQRTSLSAPSSKVNSCSADSVTDEDGSATASHTTLFDEDRIDATSSPFASVKLRSTGLAANLISKSSTEESSSSNHCPDSTESCKSEDDAMSANPSEVKIPSVKDRISSIMSNNQ